MTSPVSVSIVLPAYQEEAGLRRCLEALEPCLARWAPDHEIIVVDDGSRDGTAALVEELQRELPALVLLRHPENRGLGATLRTGFAACTRELTFYSDADLPFDFHELGRALRVMRFTEADAVTAFRFDRTREGTLRILYSYLYNLLVRVVLRIRIKDVNFSFKLVRTTVLQGLDLRSRGSFIDAEMMAKLIHGGHRVCQIGVDYFPRTSGRSHLTSVRTILGILKEMVLIGPSVFRGRRAPR